MCLEISKNKAINTKRINKLIYTNNVNGLVFGYKHFRKNLETGRISSTYCSAFKWEAGWVKSDRVVKEIIFNELYQGEINHGFHIFLNKKDALWDMQDNRGSDIVFSKYLVRKVWFKPEDLVAVGKFAGVSSAVVTKLLVRFD